tara:strand:- start:26534 stop:26761 length:228 start_codon:yes stop_codon:yes gene_type:complete
MAEQHTIRLLNGSDTFENTLVTSTTVGALRTELDIPNSATVNVNQARANNDTELVPSQGADFAVVSVVYNNKTGG